MTRDYGAEGILDTAVEDPSASDTVIRVLDREADIETQYGGGFVSSIDGVENGVVDGRSVDWFFYVDGVESPIGSADVKVEPGDRIWWDHHDWTDVNRVPAVVGSWPAPFAGAKPATVSCADTETAACEVATDRVESAGAEVASAGAAAPEGTRVVVGPWEEVRADREASALAGSPTRTGVFARFERSGPGWELATYDPELGAAGRLGPGTGLVAALEGSGENPTWVVTGTDEAGAQAAASALGEEALANRFAVAITANGETEALPAP